MGKRRIKYLPLAAVLISVAMLTVIVSGIGITQGRINNVLAWNSVYSTTSGELESNHLEKGGQTVLLESWSIEQGIQSTTETINLSSTTGTVEGTLTCITSSDLISASIDKNAVVADEDGESVTLVITMKENALSINKKTEVSVQVGWIPSDSTDGNITHYADFKIDIYPQDMNAETGEEVAELISSNYLAVGGKNIVFSDWYTSATSTYRMWDLELISNDGDQTGTLFCETNSKYLQVMLDNSEIAQSITVGEDSKYISVLKIILLEDAGFLAEPIKETVRVTWIPDSVVDGNQDMWAEFVINIVPAYSEELDDSENMDTLNFENVPSQFVWDSFFEIPVECSQKSDIIELSYNGGEFPAGTEYSSDGITQYELGDKSKIKIKATPEETVDVLIKLKENSKIENVDIGVTVYSYSEAIARGTKSLTPYSENEEKELLESGAYPSEISSKEEFLLEVNVPENANLIKLGYNGGAFPSYVRYRTDDGQYVKLGRSEKIEISAKSSIDIYIDFSQTQENLPESVSIKVEAYKGDIQLTEKEIQIKTTLNPLSAKYDLSQMIIHHDGEISFQLAGENEKTILKVQKFSSADGQMAYVEDENNFGLNVKTENGVLSISNLAGKAKAGTYRIVLLREQNGHELIRIEIPFFIHY